MLGTVRTWRQRHGKFMSSDHFLSSSANSYIGNHATIFLSSEMGAAPIPDDVKFTLDDKKIMSLSPSANGPLDVGFPTG